MDFYAKYSDGQFIPEHDSDYEAIKKLRNDHHYKVTVTSPRNYEFHKKFMALINLAFANQETFNNFDSCRKWLTMKSGFYTETITPTGVMYEPKSLAFSSMDEIEFQEVYSKVLDEICKWLGANKADMIDQLTTFM